MELMPPTVRDRRFRRFGPKMTSQATMMMITRITGINSSTGVPLGKNFNNGQFDCGGWWPDDAARPSGRRAGIVRATPVVVGRPAHANVGPVPAFWILMALAAVAAVVDWVAVGTGNRRLEYGPSRPCWPRWWWRPRSFRWPGPTWWTAAGGSWPRCSSAWPVMSS